MNTVAIGLDLVELDRFERIYGEFDPDVLNRVFTAREQAVDGTASERLTRLAARFAVKEAAKSCIRIADAGLVRFRGRVAIG